KTVTKKPSSIIGRTVVTKIQPQEKDIPLVVKPVLPAEQPIPLPNVSESQTDTPSEPIQSPSAPVVLSETTLINPPQQPVVTAVETQATSPEMLAMKMYPSHVPSVDTWQENSHSHKKILIGIFTILFTIVGVSGFLFWI